MTAIALLSLAIPSVAAQELAWTVVASSDAPRVRQDASVVWTGEELVLWGGQRHLGEGERDYFGDGARFRPRDASWRALAETGAPSARAWHRAVWSGTHMLVFGGQDQVERPDAGAWEPRSDRWSSLPVEGAPAPRVETSALWTGAELIVFGGVTEERSFIGGGRLVPDEGLWKSLARAPLPYGPRSHGAVWTGAEMLVFGGINGGSTLDIGLRYDPLEDRWRHMSSAGAPSARGYPAVAWTGDRLAVFGGSDHVYRGRPAAGGALYDPAKDRWQAIAAEGAPAPRDGHVLAWTGERLLVFGGSAGDQDEDRGWFDDGAQYDVELERWEPLPRAPLALIRPMGAWTPHGLVLVGQATPADERFTVMVLAARDEE